MQNIKKSASEYFESKPTVKEVHATSDGFLFEKKQDATAHARTLEDQDVQTIYNSADTEKSFDEMTVPELKIKAAEMEFPEADWKSLKKDDLVKYLTEKLATQE